MIRISFILLVSVLGSVGLYAQDLPVPEDMGSEHPRIFGTSMKVEDVQALSQQEWARDILRKTEARVAPYLVYFRQDTSWLMSRLQMFWKNRYDQSYINGGVYAYSEGEAPVPTIRFTGTRDHRTNYKRPKLEELIPFSDDDRGLYLQHRDRPDEWEWVDQAKTGRIIESINREILSLARDAAFLYWYTSEEDYARLAYSVLDTYLQGLRYLKEPIDLSHGHHQTLVGYTSFEVIQEHIVNEVTQCYDFLYPYLSTHHPERLGLYSTAMQRWADQIIRNGVSFNNWNLLQAAHISKIALVLENNEAYANGKGGPYYLDQIMNHTSTRQWSMRKLIEYGYDPVTGIWNESPGYAMNVLNDFIHFVAFYDRSFGIDLLAHMPVLRQAAISALEYLAPNNYMLAFGDGHYKHLPAQAYPYLIENARRYGKKADEELFTQIVKTLFPALAEKGERRNHLEDLFAPEGIALSATIPAATLDTFTSPLFYAPNTSWLVQRRGEGDEALLISQIGSLGNHMHSNGIAMELYGCGLPMAPEMGHGSSYFSIEYAEYYTQFPAHNTVIVNGRSKYPEMKSNHAFQVEAAYPESGLRHGNWEGIRFSDLRFREPETQADQRRLMGIVAGENGHSGYYFDIFRSHQEEGPNIKHEYFYHNLGQNIHLQDSRGNSLPLSPTTALSFGDGDLMAYDYLWDKSSVEWEEAFHGQVSFLEQGRQVGMKLWFAGAPDRQVFTALSPKSTALRHGPVSKEWTQEPIPTLVVRQTGEAWTRPFMAVYEPDCGTGTTVKSVENIEGQGWNGLSVMHHSGRKDYLLSAPTSTQIEYEDISFQGTFGMWSKSIEDWSLFVGAGSQMTYQQKSLLPSSTAHAAVLEKRAGQYYLMTEGPCTLQWPQSIGTVLMDAKGNTYTAQLNEQNNLATFNLPALPYGLLKIVKTKAP